MEVSPSSGLPVPSAAVPSPSAVPPDVSPISPALSSPSALPPVVSPVSPIVPSGLSSTASVDVVSNMPNQTVQLNPPDVEKAKLERGVWTNPLDYVMSMVAFAVGLGNVWRFPYLAFKYGGGTFLAAYACFFVTVAVPMMLMEACVGQYLGLGAIEIWKIVPILKGVGIANIVLCFIVVCYYHVIIVWAIHYLINSFTDVFPWEKCHPALEEKSGSQCFAIEYGKPFDKNWLDPKRNSASAASQYFDFRVLDKTFEFGDLGSIRWELVGIMLVLWVVIYFCIWRSLIKARYFVWFSALFPYVILFSLLIRGFFLPGAWEGIKAYILPQPEQLIKPTLWKDAGSQIFFSYGIGNGGIISLSAYNNFNHNVVRDSVITCFVNGCTSIIAGFAVFCYVGYMAKTINVEMIDINKKTTISGTGLGFKIYPEAVVTIFPKQLWAIAFFLMLVLLGLNSQVCLAEGLYSTIEDRFPKLLRVHKKKCLILYCLVIICLSQIMVTQSGELWLGLIDMYGAAGHSLLFVAFFEVVGIAWGFGAENVLHGIYEMRGTRPCSFWVILWKYVGPITIAATFILSLIFYGSMGEYMDLKQKGGAQYSPSVWMNIVAIMFSLASMIVIPGYAAYYMWTKDPDTSFKDRFFEGLRTPVDVNKERVLKFSMINVVVPQDIEVVPEAVEL